MTAITKAANAHTTISSGYSNPSGAYTLEEYDWASCVPYGSGGEASAYWGFPSFSVSDIPDGSVINSVTVGIYWKLTSTSGVNSQKIQVTRGTSVLGTEQTDSVESTTSRLLTHQITSGVSLSDLRNSDYVRARTRSLGTGSYDTFLIDYIYITVDYSPANPPTVTTLSASGIYQDSAVLGGSVTSDGGATVTSRGVCINTSGTPTLSDTVAQIGSGTGAFSSRVYNLQEDTYYYVRAYATNAAGTSYGTQIGFSTLPEIPTVTSSAASGIGTTGATLSGNASGSGITNRGFCYNTGGWTPDITDTVVQVGSGTGNFSKALTGLAQSTTYYFRAYAVNDGGVGYSSTRNFTTLSAARILTASSKSISSYGPEVFFGRSVRMQAAYQVFTTTLQTADLRRNVYRIMPVTYKASTLTVYGANFRINKFYNLEAETRMVTYVTPLTLLLRSGGLTWDTTELNFSRSASPPYWDAISERKSNLVLDASGYIQASLSGKAANIVPYQLYHYKIEPAVMEVALGMQALTKVVSSRKMPVVKSTFTLSGEVSLVYVNQVYHAVLDVERRGVYLTASQAGLVFYHNPIAFSMASAPHMGMSYWDNASLTLAIRKSAETMSAFTGGITASLSGAALIHTPSNLRGKPVFIRNYTGTAWNIARVNSYGTSFKRSIMKFYNT